MYTGIVQGAFTITRCDDEPGLRRLSVELPDTLLTDITIGASVGLDGVCMTVTRIDGNTLHFDAMAETLRLTTLGQLKVGDLVNVERSARQGAEIGGHLISGHIDGTAEVVERQESENNLSLHFKLPDAVNKYVFTKGFIGLHGCSLTVATMDRSSGIFSVCLIPETLRATNLGALRRGDRVNIEVDRQTQVIVDTVERVLAEQHLGV
ncbi:riboflavin synthase subunit alpha [Spongiibacter sp. KMU-166]|uniref:Riboflavin synthase n=1 Tax=Spongiibacter thalassae TaxID=2721624 RepID=A0ABX1GMQ9_9GAMM|nr:riboflavin synthase subunit alpha [Spongiibacter thalassae]NKI19602.1 riboflavin synthase subunit alpha [Spongiibacter thalassae]